MKSEIKLCPFTLRLQLHKPKKNQESARYTYHIIQNTRDYETGAFMEIEIACSTVAGPVNDVTVAGLNHISELMKSEDVNGRANGSISNKAIEKAGC